MNEKVWTQEEAVEFAKTVALCKRYASRFKQRYWVGMVLFVVNAFFAGTSIGQHQWLLASFQIAVLFFVWFSLSLCKRHAADWRECYHHGQRSLVEEGERVKWHLGRLRHKLHEMEK